MAGSRSIMPAAATIVEADPTLTKLVSDYLYKGGLQVVDKVGPGEVELGALVEVPRDLFIIDWKFKAPHGQEIYEAIRDSEANVTTPVILVAGLVTRNDVQIALVDRNANFLVKPFTEEVFFDTLLRPYPMIKKFLKGNKKERAQILRGAGGERVQADILRDKSTKGPATQSADVHHDQTTKIAPDDGEAHPEVEKFSRDLRIVDGEGEEGRNLHLDRGHRDSARDLEHLKNGSNDTSSPEARQRSDSGHEFVAHQAEEGSDPSAMMKVTADVAHEGRDLDYRGSGKGAENSRQGTSPSTQETTPSDADVDLDDPFGTEFEFADQLDNNLESDPVKISRNDGPSGEFEFEEPDSDFGTEFETQQEREAPANAADVAMEREDHAGSEMDYGVKREKKGESFEARQESGNSGREFEHKQAKSPSTPSFEAKQEAPSPGTEFEHRQAPSGPTPPAEAAGETDRQGKLETEAAPEVNEKPAETGLDLLLDPDEETSSAMDEPKKGGEESLSADLTPLSSDLELPPLLSQEEQEESDGHEENDAAPLPNSDLDLPPLLGSQESPIAPVEPEESADESADRLFPRLRRAAVADSDETFANIVEKYLRSIGVAEVEKADDGTKLAKLLTDERPFDIVVMDWRLKGTTSLCVYNRLRFAMKQSRLPVLVTCGFVKKEDFRILDESAYTVFMEKPFQEQVLAEHLKTLMNGIVRQEVDHARVAQQVKEAMEGGEDIRRTIELALKECKDPFATVIAMGDMLFAHERYADSERAYRVGLKLKPKNLKSVNGLAKIFHRTNRPELAMNLLQRAQQMSPHNIERLCLLGEVGLTLREPEKARKYFDNALGIDPNSVVADAGIKLSNNLEDYLVEEGEGGFEHIGHKLSSTMNLVGITFVRNGEINRGIEQYRSALCFIDAPTLRARLELNLGLAHLRDKDLENAMKWFEVASRSDPQFGKAGRFVTRTKRLMEVGGSWSALDQMVEEEGGFPEESIDEVELVFEHEMVDDEAS